MSSQLILNKRGASLSVRNGSFLVRSEEQEQSIAVHHISSICLHPSTKLTQDAVLLSIKHNIDLLFIDAKGFPVGRVWSNRFGSISTIRKNQIAFAQSKDAIEWVKDTLLRKADNQLTLIHVLVKDRTDFHVLANLAMERIEKYKQKIVEMPITKEKGEIFASFRGFEGAMSRTYFDFITQILPEAYQFEKRTQRPAKDMFNALLNYSYGMLYGYVESALIKAGIDPFLGIMHRDEYNRPVLTYDVIEKYRTWADYVVCFLCNDELVLPSFFDVKEGVYWLNPAGKRLLITAMNDYLHEVVVLNKLSRSRQVHIELEAQQFAQELKRFNPTNLPEEHA